jgi:hypothetical protein
MTTREIIQRMVQERMTGRNVDVVGFVEQLIHVVGLAGEVHCIAVGDDRLRFAFAQEPAIEVELDHASGKLRMICARLAVLGQGATQPCFYGDEGFIAPPIGEPNGNGAASGMEGQLGVRFSNKPGEVWFNLQCNRNDDTKPGFETETQRVRS